MLSIDITFAVIFLLVWVLVLILSKVFFKPVGRMMEERGSRSAGDQGGRPEGPRRLRARPPQDRRGFERGQGRFR